MAGSEPARKGPYGRGIRSHLTSLTESKTGKKFPEPRTDPDFKNRGGDIEIWTPLIEKTFKVHALNLVPNRGASHVRVSPRPDMGLEWFGHHDR